MSAAVSADDDTDGSVRRSLATIHEPVQRTVRRHATNAETGTVRIALLIA